jgi:hypothetical protein
LLEQPLVRGIVAGKPPLTAADLRLILCHESVIDVLFPTQGYGDGMPFDVGLGKRADLLQFMPGLAYDCSFIGGNMPTLKAPNQVAFLVSLILAIVAWISVFAGIPYIGGHPSILMTLAYVVLALGCFL